ncbi:hypothetical protein ACFQVA_26765 [Actinomadura keratinilytica]
MILGNYALQRGWDPAALTDWFHRCFVDGYDWVMLPNVLGMSQYADGGRMTTKPYASGGAYLNRMSDYCSPCAYRPDHRTGDRACPYTAATGPSSTATTTASSTTRAPPRPPGGWNGSQTWTRWCGRRRRGGTGRPESGPVPWRAGPHSPRSGMVPRGPRCWKTAGSAPDGAGRGTPLRSGMVARPLRAVRQRPRSGRERGPGRLAPQGGELAARRSSRVPGTRARGSPGRMSGSRQRMRPIIRAAL